ncbi:hypothetical protein SH139x_002326 [Planctomycetaceae bacterium SH139]
MSAPLSRLVARGTVAWLLLIAAEIVHGVVRGIFIQPLVGQFRANQIGVFTGSAIILCIAYLTVNWVGAKTRSQALLIGALWLVMTVAFEILFGIFVMQLSWRQLAASYNLLEGGLMPVGLLLMFFSPLISLKFKQPTRHPSR